MFKLTLYLLRTMYFGTMVVCSCLKKVVKEEIIISRQAAKERYRDHLAVAKCANNLDREMKMTLHEAIKILNMVNLNRSEATTRFEKLFRINDKSNGGSFYIQSKIYRAYERIDRELSKTKNT